MDQFTSGVELITPEIAKRYLEKNIGNRPINKYAIDLYAQQMKEGLWQINNDAISFNENGRLLNGQHRLKALIQSNTNQQFFVIRGLNTSAFVTMDNGKSRIAGDVLCTYGIENGKNAAAIVKRKMMLADHNNYVLTDKRDAKGGGNASRTKISNALIVEEYYKHSADYDEFASAAKGLYTRSRLLSTSDYGGIIAYLILVLHHPHDTVMSFFDEFTDRKPTTNNAVMLLRNKLTQDAISTARLTSVARQKLLIKTWNAYVTGKTVRSLQYNEVNDKDLWFV